MKRLFLLGRIAKAEAETEAALPYSARLSDLVTEYFAKLGHHCLCEVIDRPACLVALAVITSKPKESAVALALAQMHIEQKARRMLDRQVQLFISFKQRSDQDAKTEVEPTKAEIEVQEIDFSQYERHASAPS